MSKKGDKKCPCCDGGIYARGVCKARYYQVKRRIGTRFVCGDGVERELTEDLAEAEALWGPVKDVFAAGTKAIRSKLGRKRKARKA